MTIEHEVSAAIVALSEETGASLLDCFDAMLGFGANDVQKALKFGRVTVGKNGSVAISYPVG